MSKILKNLAVVGFFLTPLLILGMEPEPSTVKIQTSNAQEFDVPLDVARVSETLKKMFEDIGSEQAIPLPKISGQQFDLLLPAMKSLTLLPMAELKSEEKLAQQLQQVVTNLKSNDQPLTNQQLIEFIAGVNFLNILLVEPALKALTKRTLNKDDIQKLVDLQNKLKDLWRIHPALQMFSLQYSGVDSVIESRDGKKLISWSAAEGTIKVWNKNNLREPKTTLRHPWVNGVIENLDGNYLISWGEGTIKIWGKNNLTTEPISLGHSYVSGVIESMDGKNLISWSEIEGTIKIWDKNSLAEPISLQHYGVFGVIESSDGNLISWSCEEGTIKIWDINNLDAEPITLQHPRVDGVIESRDGNNLISWSMIKDTIKVWDKNNLDAEPITLKHPRVIGVIESLDGHNLISWSWLEDIIKIWDKTNLTAQPITLQHLGVTGVIESKDGKNLISWSREGGTIKVWDKNNLTAEPITLEHPGVLDAKESMDGNLISWSCMEGTIKIWDRAFYNPTPELIQLLLTVYFVSKGQKFELTAQELAQFKATFTILSPMIQNILEKEAPDFIATIKSA